MRPQIRRKRKPALLLVGAATMAAAVLALAGPATAHHHGDHSADDPAGTIASFDSETDVLTIDLTEGGQISALVTEFTWIDDGHSHHGCGSDRARLAQRRWCHGASFRRHHWHHHHGADTSALVPGATVQDAFLMLKDGRAWFAKVELAG